MSSSPFVIVFAAGDDQLNHQIARRFAPHHPIAFLCSPAHDLAAAVRAAHAAGTEAVLFETDLSSAPSVHASVSAAAAHFGPHSSPAAAIVQVRRPASSAPFLTQSAAEFRAETSAQVAGAYAFAQAVMPLLTRGAGSAEVPRTLAFVGCEGASRSEAVVEAALVALSRSLGREYGKKYVHVAHLKFRKGSAAVEGREGEGEKRDVRVAETLWHLYTQPLSCFANELTI